MVKVGLCGFTMAIADYPLHFSVVEVQQTFYEPPTARVMQRWVEATPPHFELTMKAWQIVTHDGGSPTYRRLRRPLDAEERASCGSFRDSEVVRSAFATTLAAQEVLRASAILFQCPASFRPTPENIERMRFFFTSIAGPARPAGVRYLWEPRGPAWTKEAPRARALAAELGLVHVIDPLVTPPVDDGLPAYFRLHGLTGARHVYTDAELRRLVDLTPESAYVMFNNIPRVSDAKRFLTLLRGAVTQNAPVRARARG